MKISEVEGLDSEKSAADTMKKNADRLKQQATQAAARVKLKTAQQQVVKSMQPQQPK